MIKDHRLRVRRGGAAVTLLVLTAMAAPAAAQQTRVEARAREQAEKATRLTPYAKRRAERAAEMAERFLAGAPSGLYPWFGSVLGSGWLALGVGYRKVFADTGALDITGGWSLKNYKMVRSSLTLPALADRRLRVRLHGSWLDADQLNFFGIGNDAPREQETSYLYRPTTAGAAATFAPLDWLVVGGGLDYLRVHTGSGNVAPSIEQIFTAADAPGLGASATYLVGRAFAAIDWRDAPLYSRRGGFYRVEYSTYADRDDALSFDRVEIELVQYVPFVRDNWVLAFRGLASMSKADAGREVPYFMMEHLGGSRTLRGFPNRRFRDRNLLLLSGEYRWTPSHFLDMALFVDTGKVAARREDLNLDGLKTSYGFGLRFHSPSAVVVRWDFAWSPEGFKWIFSNRTAF